MNGEFNLKKKLPYVGIGAVMGLDQATTYVGLEIYGLVEHNGIPALVYDMFGYPGIFASGLSLLALLLLASGFTKDLTTDSKRDWHTLQLAACMVPPAFAVLNNLVLILKVS